MKKIASIASLSALGLALVGCGGADDAADATAEETEMASEDLAAPDELTPGISDVTYADGSKATLTINEDGSYELQPADGLARAGIASMQEGKTCFDPSGPDEAVCWTSEEPGEDGSFKATNDAGVTVTVSPKSE